MRILVVEDDLKGNDFLKASLEAECFSVDTAYNGTDGCKLAQMHIYDLIILGDILPGMTGLEMCLFLRKESGHTPILILSTLSDVESKVQALNAGVDDYLTKPFSFQELHARIRALLRRPIHIQSETLIMHGITLDTRCHIVVRENTEIRLTKKEFMLLEYLMTNAGIVLSRRMIMEHVWDMYADPFSNTIESHILSLRKKIGGIGRTAYIRTISGCGYTFDI